MSIGNIMKLARLEKKLTIKDIASQLKVAESTYRDWENGRKIQGEPYSEISRILEIELSLLIGVSSRQSIKSLKNDVELLDEQIKKIKQSVYSLL